MQIEDIHLAALAGFNFNVEEKVLLQSALPTLKQDYKLSGVSIWGKILGTQRDYIILQGLKNEKMDYIFFFSVDSGLNWGQLAEPLPNHLKKAEGIYRRFTGDPAFVYAGVKKESEDEQPFTEEKRVAAVIAAINLEAFCVPQGAFYKHSNNKVSKNPLFQGLSLEQASNLKSYVHMTPEFESVDNDIPKGCWVIKKDQTSKFVLVQSLTWPGFSLLHAPNTQIYGSVYIGTGQKNQDLGFML